MEKKKPSNSFKFLDLCKKLLRSRSGARGGAGRLLISWRGGGVAALIAACLTQTRLFAYSNGEGANTGRASLRWGCFRQFKRAIPQSLAKTMLTI